ncbi:hypothetical protein E3N88_14457 [Mikania micrantha]|uniref:MULE transposase domain-containing protein n=1 Tax=Mikania micrantha TaxID=192012 RepID=A0A5N6P2T4_9ASTR|nr:hypothetical protein E3N88_14457 [Mikania micrantha]
MELIESIQEIPVQNPSVDDFCAADLKWVKFGNPEHYDDVALIPYARVDEFIYGECSNVESPTRFHIERGRKRLKAKKIPYIGNEIQQQTMSMIYLGIPEENVLEKHIEGIQRYCGSDVIVNSLASQYVHKLGMIIKRSTHELDLDDEASVRIWAERNKKSIFYYQETAEPFVLGIQTEWQLQQMLRFGHHSIIAVDSTFGIKRLKYPLCTLLVFDSRQHALPVAWVITRSVSNADITKWMKALLSRVHAADPTWKVNGFLIDDAAAETDPIRETFSCPVLFSLWRVRRSWLRHIVKNCRNIEVQREIFKRLGEIVYSIWSGVNPIVVLEKFTYDFVDQTDFMQYFTATWVPKIG